MSKNLKEFRLQLESELKNCSNVIIVGHEQPDFDSIGSAIGLCALAEYFEKKAYIVVNEDEIYIEPGVKIIMEANKERIRFIKKSECDKLINKRTILITTDVNKSNRISLGDYLDRFKSIVIVDHHGEGEDTIKTDKCFIDPTISSASEIITRMLCAYKIKFDANTANALLAGINLDTNRFKRNSTSKTHEAARRLIDRGANTDYVNKLVLEDFETFCRISNLIINGTTIKKYSESLSPIQVSFTLNKNNPREIYKIEDYAKAADRMLKFNGIDASFALGYIDDETVHISARGNKKVNVGKIMEEMYGGGNAQSAGGRVKSDDIIKIEELLMDKITVGLSDEEPIIEHPKVIKVKQIKREKPLKK